MWYYSVRKEVSRAGFLKTLRENAKLELSKNTTYPDKSERYIACCKVTLTNCYHSFLEQSIKRETQAKETPTF